MSIVELILANNLNLIRVNKH